MATMLDANEEPMTKISFPIEKSKTHVDPVTGDVIVYGKATDCTVDTDDQIVDGRWAAKAVQDWLATGGNIRVQHNPLRDPAGVGIEAHGDGKGGQWVRARIVEPIAKSLVLCGALGAYSVGILHPQIVSDPLARNGRIVGGILGEISLVDRPANKNCTVEHQLVKAAKNGGLTWVDKTIGDAAQFLTKAGSINTDTTDPITQPDPDVITVDLPRGAAISVSPADLAKMQTFARQVAVEKRQFDPGVGGGVDRDKLPAEDFAGPDRSYPIVSPKDVEDAGGLIGHADDPEAVKRRIISIARRKGPAFEAKIPDSWKDGNKGMTTDTAGDEKVVEPDLEKAGAKKCPECGANYHADSKLKKCSDCGAKLPVADKATGVDLEKGKKPKPTTGDDDRDPMTAGKEPDDADGDVDDDTGDDDDDASKSAIEPVVKKGKIACTKCGMAMKGKSNFCPGCGAKAGAVNKGKSTPNRGVTGNPSPAVEPVPAHREPDGEVIEAFEHDADLPTDPDSEMKTAMRHASLGIVNEFGALHDLTCPAFHPTVAQQAHPHFSLKGLDVSHWQYEAFDAATDGTFEDAELATKRWQHAVTIANTDDEVLTELRYAAHKAFNDANLGPGSAPSPSSVTPGQFKRPYLTAGRARPSFQQQGPNTAPIPNGQISASDYQRSLITTGHAADSPANKGEYDLNVPGVPGQLTQVKYTGIQRANAQQALSVVHDHIAQTFPDLCPMAPVRDDIQGGAPSTAQVVTTKAAEAPTTKKADKGKGKNATSHVAPPATTQADLDAAVAKSVNPELIKAAVTEAIAPLVERLALATASLKKQRKINDKLQKRLEAMADLPDPRTAPWRGQAQPGALSLKSAGQPVAGPGAAATSAAAQMQYLVQRELEQQMYDEDPRTRETAWMALNGFGTRGMR